MTQTPLTPSLVSRIAQAAQYVVRGQAPSGWFGPGQPVAPLAPADTAGRRFDYPAGYNLNYTPRASEALSFGDLRALADNCDILRSVIETRKDQMEALSWAIRIIPSGNDTVGANAEQKARIAYITSFLQSPDKENSFAGWLRQILEDMFVIDAACVYKRRARDGSLYALEVMDGATVKILLDESGRLPHAPEPAYQQVLKGVPATDYTRDELLYMKHNPRSHKVYGYSHVEQVVVTVNILIRRALHQLEYYRDGSQPDAFIGLPKEWNQDQIMAFQKHFDAMLAGNLGLRRRLRFMPGDFQYKETKAPPLKDAYDDFLARIICFVFSVSPEPFVSHVNRATAQSSQERATDEGLVPLQRYVREMMNRILRSEFGSPDLEFIWQDVREQNAKDAATIDVAYVGAGIMTVDEVRARLGLAPMGRAKGKEGVSKFNPHHDEKGRFASGDGGGETQVASAVEAIPAAAAATAIIGAAIAAHNVKPVILHTEEAQPSEVSSESEDKKKDDGSKTADILMPDGKLLGEPGNGPDVQVMPEGYKGEKGESGAGKLFEDLKNSQGSEGVKDITPEKYKGTMVQLPNGDVIGIRIKSSSGLPTVDSNTSATGRSIKFKFPN